MHFYNSKHVGPLYYTCHLCASNLAPAKLADPWQHRGCAAPRACSCRCRYTHIILHYTRSVCASWLETPLSLSVSPPGVEEQQRRSDNQRSVFDRHIYIYIYIADTSKDAAGETRGRRGQCTGGGEGIAVLQ